MRTMLIEEIPIASAKFEGFACLSGLLRLVESFENGKGEIWIFDSLNLDTDKFHFDSTDKRI